MTGDPQPNGLHRRIEAQERRLTALEASMLEQQAAYARLSRPGIDTGESPDRLAATQAEYDETLSTLRGLESVARRLRDWGLTPADTATWASASRALKLPASASPHRAIRFREPVLHVLLHRFAFDASCVLDGVSYQE